MSLGKCRWAFRKAGSGISIHRWANTMSRWFCVTTWALAIASKKGKTVWKCTVPRNLYQDWKHLVKCTVPAGGAVYNEWSASWLEGASMTCLSHSRKFRFTAFILCLSVWRILYFLITLVIFFCTDLGKWKWPLYWCITINISQCLQVSADISKTTILHAERSCLHWTQTWQYVLKEFC